MVHLNPTLCKFSVPSGGHCQSGRFGPHETQTVSERIEALKRQSLGVFQIEHDIHIVMRLCDRASVRKNGQLVATVNVEGVTDDDILGRIVPGKTKANTKVKAA